MRLRPLALHNARVLPISPFRSNEINAALENVIALAHISAWKYTLVIAENLALPLHIIEHLMPFSSTHNQEQLVR